MNLLNADFRYTFCTEKLIPTILNTAKNILNSTYSTEKKGHGNFVTSMDISIEAELKKNLRRLIPESCFIAEESIEETPKSDFRWIIDPIDGTTNYIYGLPYTISVALEYCPQNELIIGVVIEPKNGIIYYACKSKGSFVIKNNNSPKRLCVGSFPDNEGIIIFGMPYNRKKTDKIFEIAKKFYQISSDLKRIGPSSLDICLVASGIAKAYFELDLNIWDVAAGILILTEAGGQYIKLGDLMIFCGEIETDDLALVLSNLKNL